MSKYVDVSDYANRKSGASPDHEPIRKLMARTIAEALEEEELLAIFGPQSCVGPLGGRSEQLVIAAELDDEIHCIIVQVYCDEASKRHLEGLLDKAEEDSKADKKLRKMIKRHKDG